MLNGFSFASAKCTDISIFKLFFCKKEFVDKILWLIRNWNHWSFVFLVSLNGSEKICSHSASYILKIWFHRTFPVGSSHLVFRISYSFLDFVALSKYKKLFVIYGLHVFTKILFGFVYPIFDRGQKSIIF